uniref:Uncharacterized protein n=1 Tax=uncultured marine virus TaxID=186617 RepID=A0A0F7LBX7_9VIRU|nr:hypothetical protein [uncultured marine virus]
MLALLMLGLSLYLLPSIVSLASAGLCLSTASRWSRSRQRRLRSKLLLIAVSGPLPLTMMST